MGNVEQRQSSWNDYYKAVGDRPARELFRHAIARFGQSGSALDLGCGSGIETVELLKRGWRVLAIDREPDAMTHLMARIPPEQRERLDTQLSSFEDLHLPEADFIWAGLSLPFCPPEHFGRLWAEMMTALRPGGRLAADFFGVRHVWADNHQMTFHTAEQVRALCDTLHLEFFSEEEGERPTALHGIKAWHAFSVVARKPDAS